MSGDQKTPDVVVVGSVAFDTVKTPSGARERMLGGSASYCALAASLFARTALVGVVGDDFGEDHFGVYRAAGIDLEGLRAAPGRTFSWGAEYDGTLDDRRTLFTDLGTFADFSPDLPGRYREAPVLVLGNISPYLQARVLDQARPRLSILDTMDLWIDTARDGLLDVVRRVDLLTVNEHEARALSGEPSLLAAARALLAMGPRHVLVKKGSHGAFLMGRGGERDILMAPSWPLFDVVDTTGAGDTFAGAFAGALAREGTFGRDAFRGALAWATVVAARVCGSFGLDALAGAALADFEADRAAFADMLVR